MLSETERKIILDCARTYKVGAVFLFGSSASKDSDFRDIDLGVKGIDAGLFF